jgi:uncharacterized protein YgbK (DUF1537 family)
MRASEGGDMVGMVGIVADDLTGANDASVHFAGAGWQVRIALATSPGWTLHPPSAIVVLSDARALDGPAARASTAAAVSEVARGGAERVFLKIDSTMRGSVPDQVAGALEGWAPGHPGAFALVCPAYPSMGRTVSGGRILVHGAGVHTTQAGRDPVTPVASSSMGELIPGSVNIRLGHGRAQDHVAQVEHALSGGGGGGGVVVLDAVTDEDMVAIARVVAILGPKAVPVGSAGLASALSTEWAATRRGETPGHQPAAPHAAGCVAVIVTSLHDASRAQCQTLVTTLPDGGILALEPPLDVVLNPEAIVPWTVGRIAKSPAPASIVLVVAPAARAPLVAGGIPASATIAEGLALAAASVLDCLRVGALVLVGGEGARAVLRRLGARSILVRESIGEGIPVGTIEGGLANGLTVVTKAGAFGTPDTLARIVAELIAGSLEPPLLEPPLRRHS